MDKALRLALLLADGSGDFDFIRMLPFQDTVILEGHVNSYQAKRKAEEIARYVGYTTVVNALRVFPGEEKGSN